MPPLGAITLEDSAGNEHGLSSGWTNGPLGYRASMESFTSSLFETIEDFRSFGKALGRSPSAAPFKCEVVPGKRSLWIVITFSGSAGIVLRTAYSADANLEAVSAKKEGNALIVHLVSPMGRWRVRCQFPSRRRPVLHYTVWLTPAKRLTLPFWPRDIYPVDSTMDPTTTQGAVHTAQRGPRTGLVLASLQEPRGGTFLYVQNFTAINDYSKMTNTSPAGRVGGAWPELGYSPAPSPDKFLEEGNEIVVSDAFVAVDRELPNSDRAMARIFLDLLADVYAELPRPTPTYHDWPLKAAQTVRDLAFSPKCSYIRQGARYLTPYVGDQEKPPESMVQLTVCVALLEYEQWMGRRFVITERLQQTLETYFVDRIGSIVRWLPGEKFGDTGEAGQSHANMDSWYLYHILFNMYRLAALGNPTAIKLFRRSLPYAISLARRFDYDFPIFFDVNTLEVVRAESKPGLGGEHDVAGLYALVLMHAYEIFGDRRYLEEAKKAAEKLNDLGFSLGYQMNTTGFAAEALLRLYLETGEQVYLENSYVCLANMFDNMWIWEADYGHARYYTTFFGMFPLRDAPYMAAYEELEALAKFHDYSKMGRSVLRPSARLLIAEYCKYVLDRAWYYFPANLPSDSIAAHARNGNVERALAIPLEDLQDGFEQSGQVGQEIYGAGLALVCTTRHVRSMNVAGVEVFCEYPMMNFEQRAQSCRFDVGGDERLPCRVRLVPTNAGVQVPAFTLRTEGAREIQRGTISSEGHLVFEVPGGSDVTISWRKPSKARSTKSRP